MIRFSCPRCRAVHELPADHAGRKVNCPKCQQRLQVPRPPASKTVLAPLVGSASPPPLPTLETEPADVELVPTATTDLFRLARSNYDCMFGGVCGGLGEHTPVPSWFWRVGFVMLGFFFLSGFVLYIVFWMLMPIEDDGR